MEFKESQKELLTTTNDELIRKILAIENLSTLYWLQGFVTAVIRNREEIKGITKTNGVHSSAPLVSVAQSKITVMFGSQTGNSKKVATSLKDKFAAKGLNVKFVDMADYNVRELKNETLLFIVVSTQGEGEPPLSAEEIYEFIHSKKAQQLNGLKYSVLALGDKGYVNFCKTGVDFDVQLEKLGATRIYPRVDCDADYKEDAEKWLNGILTEIDKHTETKNLVKQTVQFQETKVTTSFTRENPGKLLVTEAINLNGRGSDKQTIHLELQDETNELDYKPGDALGIYFENSPALVDELIALSKLSEKDIVDVKGHPVSIKDFLLKQAELTNLTRDVIEKYYQYITIPQLAEILSSNEKLSAYIYGRDIIDLLTEFPVQLDAQQLVSILRNMQPRLYSISSSLKYAPGEVHLTIASLKYEFNKRKKEGACSGYVAGNVEPGQFLTAYISSNDGFKLPPNPETDIIMIGPGTGVAPFRAFLQEREADETSGRNWLFFGEQHFTTDFLYQTDWQLWYKSKLLNNISLAFSRDQKEKKYVQHRMLEKAKELYEWIEGGAHIYVCGDKSRMAKDVYNTFIDVVQLAGGFTEEKAVEYVKNLRKQRRYHEDVY